MDHEFKAILSYIMSSRPAWDHLRLRLKEEELANEGWEGRSLSGPGSLLHHQLLHTSHTSLQEVRSAALSDPLRCPQAASSALGGCGPGWKVAAEAWGTTFYKVLSLPRSLQEATQPSGDCLQWDRGSSFLSLRLSHHLSPQPLEL